jgi:hypothetical protein
VERCPGQPQESQLKCGTQAQAGPEGPSNVCPFNLIKREELPQLEISQLRRESTPTKVWELPILALRALRDRGSKNIGLTARIERKVIHRKPLLLAHFRKNP